MNIEIELTAEQEALVRPLLEDAKKIWEEGFGAKRAMVVAQVLAADNCPGSDRTKAYMRVGFIDPDKAERLVRSAGLTADEVRNACADLQPNSEESLG